VEGRENALAGILAGPGAEGKKAVEEKAESDFKSRSGLLEQKKRCAAKSCLWGGEVEGPRYFDV